MKKKKEFTLDLKNVRFANAGFVLGSAITSFYLDSAVSFGFTFGACILAIINVVLLRFVKEVKDGGGC